MRVGAHGWFCCLVCCLAGLTGSAVHGQGTGKARTPQREVAKRPAANQPRSTTVEIELLTTDGSGLAAQEWRSALESLDLSITIRRRMGDEEPGTTEKMFGSLRKVTAIGLMNRSGKVDFVDRSFEPGDREKLKTWVQDLQVYGAQGSPDGQPLWGLNEEQFTKVFDSLTTVTEDDFRERKLHEAVRSLKLPERHPVRWTDAAEKKLSGSRHDGAVRQNTQGFTVATALAVMLRDEGLGFRPNRLPTGDLELRIDVLGKREDSWPVGWPLKSPRQNVAPKLFAMNQVLMEDSSLIDVLSHISQGAETAILFDYSELDGLGADWEATEISYRPRQATWFTVIRDVLNKAKLSCELWQDEAGRPFLDVTSLKAKRGPAAKPRE